MKLRSDFVTNSSSSSYVSFTIESKTFADIIKKFYSKLVKEKEENEYYSGSRLDVKGDVVSFEEQESYYVNEEPVNIISSLNAIIQAMFGCEDYIEIPDVDEDVDIELISEGIENANAEMYANDDNVPLTKAVILEVIEHRKDIVEDTKTINFTYSDIGWGGDDDSRFYSESYDKDTLNEIYEEIAKEKGISVEEVTEDDLVDYAGGKSSISENIYIYDKEKGISENIYNYYLE